MFILVLLLAVFRALLAPVLTLAPAVLVTQLAGPVIAEASKAGLKVSSLTQILILVLALGAGTDYGLFLVFRVREELRAGLSRPDAVIEGMTRVGESVAFSAGTVIAALLTLLLATFGLYSSLGAPLAIAIALMLLAALTLLPALLAIFGRAAFWPSRTARGAGRSGWWGRTAGRIVAHPARWPRPRSATPRPGSAAHRRLRLVRTPPRATRCSPPTSRPPAVTRPVCCCGSVRRCGAMLACWRAPSGSSRRCRRSLA